MIVRLTAASFVFAAAAMIGSAHAATLAYDGFAAGGTSPGPGQYVSQPDSTNGSNNNALFNQGPALTGFASQWTGSASDYRSYIYYRVNDAGLTYGSLQTTAGDVELFRSEGAYDSDKTLHRGTNFTGGDTIYLSLLIQFNATRQTIVKFVPTSGASIGLGTNADGYAEIKSGGSSIPGGTAGSALTAGVTHLLVARFNDDNTFTFWVDPTDLTNEAANTPAAAGTGASYTSGSFFDEIDLTTSAPSTGSSTIFDEIRVADSWADVVPIPEPASLGLFAVASLVICRRRV